jgi:coenzyme F420-reducing hydrogenase delta subunit
MKIGIFGDSFAEATYGRPGSCIPGSWTNLLKEKYEVRSYGLGGTGLDYTYYEYRQNYHKYDYNIVICSALHRQTLFGEIEKYSIERSSENSQVNLFGKLQPMFQYGLFNTFRKITLNSIKFKNELFSMADEEIITGLNTTACEYPYSNVIIHEAMKHSIKSLHSNVIIIEAFPQTTRVGMNNISEIDIKKFNASTELFGKRINHMSVEQNIQFADYMTRAIENGFDINMTLHENNVNDYYTSSSDLITAGLV